MTELRVGDTIQLLNLPDKPLHTLTTEKELGFAQWMLENGKARLNETSEREMEVMN